MSVEKAKDHYLGKNGCPRSNCCQSVVKAFQEKFSLSEEAVKKAANSGGGAAPGGQCGALYAAKLILKDHPEKAKDCEMFFAARAGSFKCSEIRSLRKLSCVGCVETIASCIEAI